MNSWTPRASLFVFLTAVACNSAPPAQPPSQPVPAPAPAAEPAPQSEAIARADALLEDFKRRQEAQDKYDREHPLPAAIPLPGSSSAPQSTSTTSPVTTPGSPTSATAAPGRDEKWWKDQMQELELKLNEELIRLAAAEKANLKYGYNDAQAEYKKIVAAVATARSNIEKLKDEARRAGVPPGWLR